METITLELDDKTVDRLRRLADSRHRTLEDLAREVLARAEDVMPEHDRFLGMFADEPSLVDQIVEMALQAREEHALR